MRDAIVRWITPDQHGRFLGEPVRPATRSQRACLSRHIAGCLGDVELHDLSRSHVWTLQQYCEQAGLGPQSTNTVTHSILRSLLRDLEAPDATVAAVSKAKRLKVPRAKKVQAFTPAQRDAVLEALRDTWGHAIGAVLLYTGVRIGEAAGLQWRDVDLKALTLTIDRQRDGRAGTKPCKTEGSHRRIHISQRLADILAALPRRGPEDFVLLGRHGGPFDIHTFRAQVWRPALRRAGVPVLNPHACRHTWATIALTSGVPLAQVAAHLGDLPRQVESTYAHVLPQFDADAALGSPPTAAAVIAERPRLRLVKG